MNDKRVWCILKLSLGLYNEHCGSYHYSNVMEFDNVAYEHEITDDWKASVLRGELNSVC